MLTPHWQNCYSSIGTWKVSRGPLASPFFHQQAWPLTADRRTHAHHRVSSPRVALLFSFCISMVSHPFGAAVPDPSVAFPPLLSFMISLLFSPIRIRLRSYCAYFRFSNLTVALSVLPKTSVLAFYLLRSGMLF